MAAQQCGGTHARLAIIEPSVVGRVSVERILSGGLEHLYQTLEHLAGCVPAPRAAAEISAAALRNEAGPHAAVTMLVRGRSTAVQ